MPKRIKKFWEWIEHFIAIQTIVSTEFFRTVMLPLAWAIVTGGAGWLGGLPLMWILMAAALAFMGTIVGVYYTEARQYAHTPLDKLRYTGTIVTYELQPLGRHARRAGAATGAQQQRHLDKTQIGVSLQNTAHFPISAFLQSADTEMEGITPPRVKYPKAPVLITPGNNVFMVDEPINMSGHPCEKLEGRMNIVVRYGLPGKEVNELVFKGRVDALMRPEGFLQMTYTHWDTTQV